MSIRVYCAKKTERERKMKKMYSVRIELFPKKNS